MKYFCEFIILLVFHQDVLGDSTLSESQMQGKLADTLTTSEYEYGRMRGRYGVSPWLLEPSGSSAREGKIASSFRSSRIWPNARVPYEFAPTIDHSEWLILQYIFKNISSQTYIKFVPRTQKDTDYLLVTEDIEEYGCGCCSIGVGYLEGSGAHVLVLAPVSQGGCGVNHIGGMHEVLHILGLTHVQNRPDRCNYIDVDTSPLVGWGEWSVSQLTESADWFKLRIPYDCSSYVHYYQLQGAVWTKEIMDKVDAYMEAQGCEHFQRGPFINSCLVKGGFTHKGRIIKDGYERCLTDWDTKHKICVDNVIKRFPTFYPVDPNGRCRANGINKSKRKSHEISQWDIWALNAAYSGPMPECQYPNRVGDGFCDPANNYIDCSYDGGDCCLPQADPFDCIDPCGVRLRFYNGTNRECRRAVEEGNFCRDHYWYGPNRCGPEYCRLADEKYLQWQCKKTCGLCNVNPSVKEMDAICNEFIPDNVRAKYRPGNQQEQFNKIKDKSKQIEINRNNKSNAQRRPLETIKNQNESKIEFIEVRKSFNAILANDDKPEKPINLHTNTKAQHSNPKHSETDEETPPIKTIGLKTVNSFKNEGINTFGNQTDVRSSKIGKNGTPRPGEEDRSGGGKRTSTGFVVIASLERRLAMRSYWASTG